MPLNGWLEFEEKEQKLLQYFADLCASLRIA
jgi:hypothetical protein